MKLAQLFRWGTWLYVPWAMQEVAFCFTLLFSPFDASLVLSEARVARMTFNTTRT